MTKQSYQNKECSCEYVNVNLGLYLHNMLSNKEKSFFEKHLNICNRCTLDVIVFRKMKELKDKEVSALPVPDIVGKAMATIKAIEQSPEYKMLIGKHGDIKKIPEKAYVRLARKYFKK